MKKNLDFDPFAHEELPRVTSGKRWLWRIRWFRGSSEVEGYLNGPETNGFEVFQITPTDEGETTYPGMLVVLRRMVE